MAQVDVLTWSLATTVYRIFIVFLIFVISRSLLAVHSWCCWLNKLGISWRHFDSVTDLLMLSEHNDIRVHINRK